MVKHADDHDAATVYSPHDVNSVAKFLCSATFLDERGEIFELLLVTRFITVRIMDDKTIVVLGYDFLLDIGYTDLIVRGFLRWMT